MPVTVYRTDTVVIPEPDEIVVQAPGGGETIVVQQTTETASPVNPDPNCALTLTETVENLVIPDGDEMIVVQSAGPQGAPGAPGVAEEEVPYAKRIDWVSDLVLYKGEAAVGSLEGATAWRIQRVTLNAEDDVTVEWADGVSDFTKVWTNRLSYTYS